MKMNTDIFKRRSIRLKGWNYSSSGLYFVTICTRNRECLFGKISKGKMGLNESGQIVAQCWKDIPNHFPHAELDEFIVMPNHVHGIIAIPGSVGAYNHTPRQMEMNIHTPRQMEKNHHPLRPMDTNNDPPGLSLYSPSKTIGSMIRGFKIGCSKCMGKSRDASIVWQRNYFEHIIRNEAELTYTRQYIRDNPAAWLEDDENPKRAF